jgi:hypothetical protein
MKYWILGGVLLVIAGLYFGIGWVQTLGIGMIALPVIILGLILVFVLVVLLAAIILGSVAVMKFRHSSEKRRKR